MGAPSKCPSCGYKGGGWKNEGQQKLPAKDGNGNFILDRNGKPTWRTTELWTYPDCGSTAVVEVGR